MITALVILAILVLVLGTLALVSAAINGDPFATIWICFGGLGNVAKLVELLVTLIVSINQNE